MTRYSKALVALIPAAIALLKVLSDAIGDGVVSPQEGIALGIAVLNALAVYAVPNTTPSATVALNESAALETPQPTRYTETPYGDRGAFPLEAVLLALLIVVLVLLLRPLL